MKWMIVAFLALGLGTAQAQDWLGLITYDVLIKDGFQIIGIIPDGKGGQVYHLRKPERPLYTCHVKLIVQGVDPIMEEYCRKVQ